MSCLRALANLAKAEATAFKRYTEYIAHGDKDPGHAKALGQAKKKLDDAIKDVKKYCNCELLKEGSKIVAVLASAEALAEKIVDALRQFCSEDPEFCYAW